MNKARLIISLLVLVSVVGIFVGCGMSPKEQQALEAIKDIPLPDAGYSSVTGLKMEWGEPEVRMSYDPDTGEPYFMITCVKIDHSLRGQFSCELNWDVCSLVLPESKERHFTLTELEEYHDRLVWR